jgi:hypothetical protein
MAHFAKLDENNIVVEVIAVANKELLDNGVESEAKGIDFCQSLFGGNWIQTSYNGNIRYNYAGVGFKYDENKDAFISPEPEDALGFDESTCQWIVPGIVDES